MKKFTYLILALFMTAGIMLAGCSCSKTNKIRVNEVTHSIFYAPMYVAINKGYFKVYLRLYADAECTSAKTDGRCKEAL